jgi:hypothetical protein
MVFRVWAFGKTCPSKCHQPILAIGMLITYFHQLDDEILRISTPVVECGTSDFASVESPADHVVK